MLPLVENQLIETDQFFYLVFYLMLSTETTETIEHISTSSVKDAKKI